MYPTCDIILIAANVLQLTEGGYFEALHFQVTTRVY